MEEIIKNLGFESLEEFHHLVAQVNLTTENNLLKFNEWKEKDYTKEGLLKLIQSNEKIALKENMDKKDISEELLRDPVREIYNTEYGKRFIEEINNRQRKYSTCESSLNNLNFIHKLIQGSDVTSEDRTIIIDTENEYKKLTEMLCGEAITISNSGSFINPFEIEVNKDNREKIRSNFKDILSQHYKFANELKGQKLSLSDIKEICVKNDFVITDEELVKIIRECEENIK